MQTLVDAGPLVAYFNKTDKYHGWALSQFGQRPAPYLTCEPVLTQTCFLIASGGGDPVIAMQALQRGLLRIEFSLSQEVDAVRSLLDRYADIGVSLADACLVRMSELHPKCAVMTVDRDFLVYRRNGRRIIPLIAPFEH